MDLDETGPTALEPAVLSFKAIANEGATVS